MIILNDTDDYTDAEVFTNTLGQFVEAVKAVDMSDTPRVMGLASEVMALMSLVGAVREETMTQEQQDRMQAWTDDLIANMPQ